MNKLASIVLAGLMAVSLANAQDIKPNSVGPVSQYGQLMTGKNSAGEGRIYGSCQGVKDGAEVQVRGMSLYWSLQPQAVEYWSDEGVSTMVKDMNIQIVRAAMATGNEDWWGEWNGQRLKGYASAPDQQKGFMKAVVEAAIKNDIYVIIDWHSHEATSQVNSAKGFFEEMAKTYGQYDNVIFELFNEPTDISWDNIKNYANQIIPTIRQYSDNLILVGTRAWDQHPEEVIGKEVTDSGKNTAYTLHYYAMSHCVSGNYSWGGSCEGANGEKAIKAGLSIFLSEWGTGTADGGGTPGQSENQKWQDFANKYKLSWANWSASHISEGTAAFGGGSNKNSLNYTASGNLVKSYLATNPTNYTKCSDGSQGGEQGGSQGGEQQGNENPNAIASAGVATLSATFAGNVLTLAGARAATVDLFDLQGRALMSVNNVAGSLSLKSIPRGAYIVRVREGSAALTKKIQIQ